MKRNGYRLLAGCIGLFFLWYIAQRSVHLSMTHDESSTTNVVDGSYTDIMFAKNMFGTANNHILNSLLLKKSVALFGWHEWSIRLPNVLSFLLYFTAVVLFMQRIGRNNFVRIAGVILFCTPHFIVDYFSLARGYGMALAFETMSLYMLVCFFEQRKQRLLVLSFAMAALAVYANFTWLNILLAQWAVVNIVLLLEKREQPFTKFTISLLRTNIAPLLMSILLALLIYKPIGYLSGNNEFKWGAETWWTALHSFIASLHYTHSHFILHYDARLLLLKFFIIGLFIAGIVLIIQQRYFNKWQQVEPFAKYSLLATVLLLTVITASTILQRHLLNTFYIDGRKALLYMPILLLLTVALFSWMSSRYTAWANRFFGVVAAASFLHFSSIFNFYSCFEWWYDASSKIAYQYIVNDESTESKTTAVNWLFSQSMDFYNKRMYNNRIPLLKKTNELSSFDGINYVYVIGDEIRTIPPVFKPVKRYMWDRFLLVRDEAAYRSSTEAFMRQQQLADSTVQLPAAVRQQKADSALLQQRQQLNWNNLLYTE